MTETLPRLTLTPVESPMPPQWARAIANDLTQRLRGDPDTELGKPTYRPPGWRPYRAVAAIDLWASGRGHAYTTPGSFPRSKNPDLSSLEILWSQPYQMGIIDPDDSPTMRAVGVPLLAWHVTQAQAYRNITVPATDAETLIKQRSIRGPSPSPFFLDTNRHGKRVLRRNYDHATENASIALLQGAEAADVFLLDPREYRTQLTRIETAEYEGTIEEVAADFQAAITEAVVNKTLSSTGMESLLV